MKSTKRFKVGTKVNVLGFDWNNEPVSELATVIRNRPNTMPVNGYQRVRCEVDGGVCYAPIESLTAV